MLKKIAVFTSIVALTVSSLSAQERDFRKERADLDRQEREQKKQNRQPALNYGTNILSITPFGVIDGYVGVGLSYEKILGADQSVGLVLPFYIAFDDMDGNSYNGYDNSSAYFYFAPGLKVYPFGQRKVTYSVGPSLFVGGGTSKETYIDYSTPNPSYYTQETERFKLGIIINNYVTFQFTKSFNLGLQGGLGVRYIDREKIDNYTNNKGISPTGQFSVTLGYRF